MTRSAFTRLFAARAMLLAFATASPAAAQVQGIRDSLGRPYQLPLGYDSVTGLQCVVGLSLTCKFQVSGDGGGGGGTLTATWTKDAFPAALLSVTTSASSATQTTGAGGVVAVENLGASDSYCLTGASSGLQATTTDNVVHPGQVQALPNLGYVSCITASGAASVRVTSGDGDPRPGTSTNIVGAAQTGSLGASAEPTAGTAGNTIPDLGDLYGRKVEIPVLRASKKKQHTTISSSPSETTIVTATTGKFHDIFSLWFNNTSSTDGVCTVKEATAGATVWVVPVKAGLSNGFSRDAGSATPQSASNANWTATCTSLSSMEITVDYVDTAG